MYTGVSKVRFGESPNYINVSLASSLYIYIFYYYLVPAADQKAAYIFTVKEPQSEKNLAYIVALENVWLSFHDV